MVSGDRGTSTKNGTGEGLLDAGMSVQSVQTTSLPAELLQAMKTKMEQQSGPVADPPLQPTLYGSPQQSHFWPSHRSERLVRGVLAPCLWGQRQIADARSETSHGTQRAAG